MSTVPQRLPAVELQLDRRNPRLPTQPARVSQAQLRRQMIEAAEVIPLAKKIIKGGGTLSPGERIVVVKEGGRWVVLEGNRRTTACQIIVDPNLCPNEYRGMLGIIPPAVQRSLQLVPIDVVPDRDTALPMIASRHAGRGILRWKPEMRTRFVGAMHEQGKSIDEIAESLRLSTAEVRKALLSHHLMSEVRQMSWTASEQLQLDNPHELATNPVTRFFEMKGARAAFPFEIDAGGRLTTTLSKPLQAAALRAAARTMLFRDDGNSRPQFNTRSPTGHILSTMVNLEPTLAARVSEARRLERAVDPLTKTGEAEAGSGLAVKPGKRHKPAEFFEQFECRGTNDDWCLHLSEELRILPWRVHKQSAAFLFRALIEATLRDALRFTQHWGQVMQAWQQEHPDTKRPVPDLSFILAFAKEKAPMIFADGQARDILGQIDGHIRRGLNMSVHGAWRLSERDLCDAAGHARRFIETLHDRSGLRAPGPVTGTP